MSQQQQELDSQLSDLVGRFGADAVLQSLRRLQEQEEELQRTQAPQQAQRQHQQDDGGDAATAGSERLAALGGSIPPEAYRCALEASFDSVFVTDRRGTILAANRASVELFGYGDGGGDNGGSGNSPLVGMNISSVVGDEMHASAHASYVESIVSQQQLSGAMSSMRDVLGRKRDGTTFPVCVGVRLVDVESPPGNDDDEGCGRRRLFVAYCHDLTQRKARIAELERERAALMRQQELNRSILDASFDAVILADGRGFIRQANASAARMFGYGGADGEGGGGDGDGDASGLVGRNVAALVADPDHAGRHERYMEHFCRRAAAASAEEEGTTRFSRVLGKERELYAKRKDGTTFPCRIGIHKVTTTTQPQAGGGGEREGDEQDVGQPTEYDPSAVMMVGFVRDVTHEKREEELRIEHRAAEQLLFNMLPAEIAERLRSNPGHIADHFETATILFADIVGFTKMSNALRPIEVVQFLNAIFTKFDERLDAYGLNKVKTIGDCYMVTSVPGSGDQVASCAAVCHFAMDMIQALQEYNDEDANREHPLTMRIGIHTGPVVAGVVGRKRFLYDIWGDAVNLASRMESTGVPGRVQCTKEVIDAVPANEFVVERRGMVQVKGIGEMETYFINAKSATSRPSSYYWNKLRSSVLDGSRQDAKSTKKQTFRDIVELLQEARQLDNANISDDQGSELE